MPKLRPETPARNAYRRATIDRKLRATQDVPQTKMSHEGTTHFLWCVAQKASGEPNVEMSVKLHRSPPVTALIHSRFSLCASHEKQWVKENSPR